jgi:hypothetical protein
MERESDVIGRPSFQLVRPVIPNFNSAFAVFPFRIRFLKSSIWGSSQETSWHFFGLTRGTV